MVRVMCCSWRELSDRSRTGTLPPFHVHGRRVTLPDPTPQLQSMCQAFLVACTIFLSLATDFPLLHPVHSAIADIDLHLLLGCTDESLVC